MLSDFKAWIDATPDNADAFANAMYVAPMSRDARTRIETLVGRTFPALQRTRGQPQRAMMPTSSPSSQAQTITGPSATPRFWMAGAVAVCVAAVFLMVGPQPYSLLPQFLTLAHAETYETGHGEIRAIKLPDGTHLTLDSDSCVEVLTDPHRRTARLRNGRARFAVMKGLRPFTISAGKGDVVTDHGTIDMGMDDGAIVDLRLRSGSARLITHQVKSPASREPIELEIDKALMVPANGDAPKVVSMPLADTRDWPSGWVEYRTVALGALVREANQYASVPILLDDPRLAKLSVSGRFQLTRTEVFAQRIAQLFGLSMVHRGDGIVLQDGKKSPE
ncbi:transmembrane sensor [Sphingobium sp. B11D3B]|nr:transmembrane sensor [Sphingobium sp. B11D3B]